MVFWFAQEAPVADECSGPGGKKAGGVLLSKSGNPACRFL